MVTLEDVKTNLIINTTTDDNFLTDLIYAAVSYAEAYQHLPDGYYTTPVNEVIPTMPPRTKQAVIMLVTRWYESRDGGTGGFFADSTNAAQYADIAVNNLLRLDREWKI